MVYIKLFEDYRNQLQEVSVGRYLFHCSNPYFRKLISKEGLIPKGKSESWSSDTPIDGEVIFASNTEDKDKWFESPYDDDIYRIDTNGLDIKWYGDPNFGWDNSIYIITYDRIPKENIELIYRGTGNVWE